MPPSPNKQRHQRSGRTVISFRGLGIPNLIRLGREAALHAREPLPAHRHRKPMEICYLAQGEQTFEISDRVYRMRGGDVLVSPPGRKHSTGAMPLEHATLYWLLVTLDAPGGRFLGHTADEGGALIRGLEELGVRRFKGSDVLRGILDRIFEAFFDDRPFRITRIRMLVTEFLIRIIDLATQPERRDLSREMVDVLAYIHDSIRQPIMLEALAEEACLSLSRFKQRFRREVGVAPREYVLRQKIDCAKELLRRPGGSVTRIAHELGFSSSQYFATVFRRFAGKSPSEFRREV